MTIRLKELVDKNEMNYIIYLMYENTAIEAFIVKNETEKQDKIQELIFNHNITDIINIQNNLND